MTHDPRRGLADVLSQQHAEERERALRALLMQPLLPASDPDFAVVRRHAEYLRAWCARETGWPVHVERECARLYKRPASLDDATRGAPEFTRERYVLLCLTCAVLERAELQITLKALGDRLLEAVADPELAASGYTFTLESARERRDLVRVCRFLLDRGILRRVAGDEEAYVTQSGDVLYDVQRRLLALLPGSVRGASLIASASSDLALEARLTALVEEFIPESAEGHRTALRHALARRLLDDPVLYHDELTVVEREYLQSQRGPMAARLAQATGLMAELRAEGLALVDPDGELSDRRLPAIGTEAHVTLLTAEHLARAARANPGRVHSLREIAGFLREAADRFGKFWRKAAREPGAELALAEDAIATLAALRLIEFRDGAVLARPALLRYALDDAQFPTEQSALL